MPVGESAVARALPVGEVTCLFTDIVGSTALWEHQPEAMRVAIAAHDELLQMVVDENSGFVFKGLGDGVCAAFGTAFGGVAAALEGQHRLLEHSWGTIGPLPVRMALHTGPAELREGDYFGRVLNRTARLVATAHGGQVVLTQATASLVEDRLPSGGSLTDLGMHRLKDLSRPEHVFQLGHSDLTAQFPPLRSLEWHQGNLPHRLTEFIGRESEIATVSDLVAAHRLVTLAGTGGIGKTSLALRTAAEIVEDFPDGAWLIELAALTDDTQVPGAAAGVFGVEAPPSRDTTEALARHLESMKTLLILDNCEHVIEGAATFTDTLLRATEQVRVLATSREPLRIDGEAILRVPSLEVPPAGSPFDDFLRVEAVALFTDRAKLARPGFAVDETNAADVIEVCRRLDGIPLAIELGAARLDTMTVDRIAECLDDRFRILTRGSRAAMPRQQTLEALIDWSHDLLTDQEQILLRRLGVFGGNFTLNAVEQVCGHDPIDSPAIVDLLDRLVEMSLVTSPEPASARYRMLETIRAYARRQLDEHAETEAAMRRLAAHLLNAGPATRDGRPQGDYVEWLRWRADEQDNYRAALNWTRDAGDGPLCTALAVEFYRYLAESSLGHEAGSWADSAVKLPPDEPSPLRLELLALMATTEAQTGEPGRARAVIQAYRDDAHALGDEAAAAWAITLDALFTAHVENDLESGLALITDAGERLLAVEDPRYEGTVTFSVYILSLLGRYDEAEALIDRFGFERTGLNGTAADDYRVAAHRGMVAFWRGDYTRAVELKESCIEPAGRVGPREMGSNLVHLGQAEFGRGNYETAQRLVDQGRSLLPENATVYVGLLTIPALIALKTQGPDAAAPHLRDALDLAGAPDYGADRIEVLTAMTEWAIAVDQPTEAAVFLAAAAAARDRIPGLVPHHWVRQHYDRAGDHVQATLSDSDLEQLQHDAKKLTYDEVAQRARTFLDEALAAGSTPDS